MKKLISYIKENFGYLSGIFGILLLEFVFSIFKFYWFMKPNHTHEYSIKYATLFSFIICIATLLLVIVLDRYLAHRAKKIKAKKTREVQ